MSQRTRLTNNSDETEIARLISGDTIFSIPYFQRPYKWKPERLKHLNDDILKLVDQENDFHFLGAVIVHGRRSNPADPNYYDVIDGQQRITTLFLYLCATVKVLCEQNVPEEAAGLFLKYLVINRPTGTRSNYKLHSCKDDRIQLNRVFADILSEDNLLGHLGGFQLKELPRTGHNTGPLFNNYKSALKFLRSEFSEGGLERIRLIYSALLNQISVVQIDVWDPLNGPKIFDSLNSRQEPMTIGDLVRNEIFSRVADRDADDIERIDAENWQPFYKKFDVGERNLFDGYFFPYGLIKNPNLKKSEVYNFLKRGWESLHPTEIIEQLAEYQNAFIDIQQGTNHSNLPSSLASSLLRLHSSGLPNSTFPFLMELCRSFGKELVSEDAATSILEVIESFLIRRAICGHEPTGLHAVFKRLWADCDNNYTAEKVSEAISSHRTVVWPSDDEFKECVKSRAIYVSGSELASFFILEYDRSLGGDTPLTISQIEHILPVTPCDEWFNVFSVEQHLSFKDCLANLIPLSVSMNASLSNRPYVEKKSRYIDDSAFKSTRKLGEEVDEWTPESLEKRALHLAYWAAERWPHKRR